MLKTEQVRHCCDIQTLMYKDESTHEDFRGLNTTIKV